MTVILYNTLNKKKEAFAPIDAKDVKLYCCGPTVYNYAHIGNLRTYIFEDLLRRTLARAGYGLTHVMNITDVGHLQSDADEGEDKMSIAAEREKKSPWDIARFYEEAFFADCKKLEILPPHISCRATEHIQEMIDMVKTLEEKGIAYQAGGNIYYDTSKFDKYSNFANLQDIEQSEGRVDADSNKHHPADFVLWFTLEGSKFPNQIMKWDSPWGEGFPGWHIECSAMATKYLGKNFDIHCGGIDHVPVHHTNEIAQSEGCFGCKWVNYWLHGEFLLMDDSKMSKSKGDFMTLQKLIDAGYDPIHYRYLCLSAHYRGSLRFSFEALDSAKQAYETLCHKADEWRALTKDTAIKPSATAKDIIKKIDGAMQDDINSTVALSLLWEALRNSDISPADKLAILEAADSALGLRGCTLKKPELTPEIEDLILKRENLRREKQWQKSDDLRNELEKQGIILKDRPEGTSWYKKT